MSIERAGTDEGSFCEVFAMLLELAREGAYARLNHDKLALDTYAVLTHGMTFIARDEDGAGVGLLGLVEESFYYSDTSYLASKWLWIAKDHRGASGLRPGPVLAGLLEAAKAEAETRAEMLFVTIDNPDRNAKRAGRARIDATILGFVPHGYIIKLR